ncbi:MAG TPA: sugar-binding protein [Anaerolineales bacterium]|nr:sugar-binding protein [Anaerolineales bacterium]
MRRQSIPLILITLALAAFACDIPGAAPPTPFSIPTPNQTLTAIFAPTAITTIVPPPTSESLPTVAVTPAETLAALPTATPAGLSRPNGTPVEAVLLTTAPTIDGDLAEWTTNAYALTQVTYGASRWSGLADASAVFYIGWDASRLYVASRVTDDKFVQVSKGEALYLGDSLEIQFDANLSADFGASSLSSDDYQLGLSPGNFGSLAAQSYLWYPATKRGAPAGVVVAGRSSSSGYTLEAAIPWTVFGVLPAEGSRYGFAISVSDNDAAGTAAQQSLISNVSTRTLVDPTTWGTLVLVGSGGT